MAEGRGTGEVEFSAATLLESARAKLKEALAMLGEGLAEDVDDDAVKGAGMLAMHAGELLEGVFRVRVDERATQRVDGDG